MHLILRRFATRSPKHGQSATTSLALTHGLWWVAVALLLAATGSVLGERVTRPHEAPGSFWLPRSENVVQRCGASAAKHAAARVQFATVNTSRRHLSCAGSRHRPATARRTADLSVSG